MQIVTIRFSTRFWFVMTNGELENKRKEEKIRFDIDPRKSQVYPDFLRRTERIWRSSDPLYPQVTRMTESVRLSPRLNGQKNQNSHKKIGINFCFRESLRIPIRDELFYSDRPKLKST